MHAKGEPYDVHTSLDEDKNEGWVWIRNSHLKNDLEGKRRIIRITAETKKKVFCEALYADPRYMKKWYVIWVNDGREIPPPTQNLAFISEWHRILLGIEKIWKDPRNLAIDYPENSLRPFWWQLCACLDHPQVVVRLATLLAIIGVGLGILGMGVGIAGVQEWKACGKWFGWSVAFIGLFIMTALPAWLTRRH